MTEVTSKGINIEGLDKVKLLRSFWGNSRPAPLFSDPRIAGVISIPQFDEKKAADAIKGGMIDYFCGRAIKMNLSKSVLVKNPGQDYDSYAVMSAKEVIAFMHANKSVPDTDGKPATGDSFKIVNGLTYFGR